MSLENDMFEGTLNELEGIYKKVEGMKKKSFRGSSATI